VKLGNRTENYVEVVEGVKEGEQVVVAANFLIDAESNLKAAVSGFGDASKAPPGGAMPATGSGASGGQPGASAPAVGHQAEGTVETVDAQAGTLSIAHGPVASLNWPAMTMKFKAANASLMAGLKPGAAVSFEFVERSPGEWVITRISPRSTAAAPDAKPGAHQGH
jgi:Cu(I)/Ag(I) efflux system membrane fusion protein